MHDQPTPKCPWPKATIRDAVNRAIENVGGPRGWEYMSTMQRMNVIDATVLQQITVLMGGAGASISGSEICAIRDAFRAEAGIR